MAIITTTIREPTTFSQIQDQQNELGKSKLLEDLNDNVVKLIEAINAKSEKQSANEDRQLKSNQLELSKLQLKRAQLGLANDEKYYQDYSRKWSEKNGIGTSVGIDKNTSGNLGAIGVSALTAGTLNPVVVKQVLFPLLGPPIKMMSNVMKGMFSFDRRVSGKTSSAIDSDNKNKLHGKLDSILSAIKEKTRSSPEREKEEKSLFSKVIGSILGLAGTVGKIVLGMIGTVLLSKLGEKIGPTIEGLLSKVIGKQASSEVVKWLEELGPAMIAGYAIGGWKGALIGGGLQLAVNAWNELFPKPEDLQKPEEVSATVTALNGYLPDPLKFNDDPHFKATLAGLMLGGLKGMVFGWVAGKYGKDFAKWIGSTPEEQNAAAEEDWKLKLAKALGLDDVKAILPVMGGFVYAGIKGAVLGYAAGQVLNMFNHEKQLEEAIKAGDELEEDRLKKELENDQYRIALAGAFTGFQVGGFTGAIMGGLFGLFGSGIAQGYKKYGSLNSAFNTELEKNYFGVPAEVWVGSLGLAALAWKSGLGFPGIIAGALIGAVGGFIADRVQSKNIIEKAGFEAEWSSSKMGYVIKGHEDLDIQQIRQQIRQDLYAEKIKNAKDPNDIRVSEEEVDEAFKKHLMENGVEPKEQRITRTTKYNKRNLERINASIDSNSQINEDAEKVAREERKRVQMQMGKDLISRLGDKGIVDVGWFFDNFEEGGEEELRKINGVTSKHIEAFKTFMSKGRNTAYEDRQLVVELATIVNDELARQAKEAEDKNNKEEQERKEKDSKNLEIIANNVAKDKNTNLTVQVESNQTNNQTSYVGINGNKNQSTNSGVM